MRTRLQGQAALAAYVLGALAVMTAAPAAKAALFAVPANGGVTFYNKNTNEVDYSTALAQAAAAAFPGAMGVPADAQAGKLLVYDNETTFLAARAARGTGGNNAFIGLTDDPAFSPGAVEGGNTSGGATPANGAVALAGQRGAGFAFTDGSGLSTFHQLTGGTSVWAGGEPNGGGSENIAEVRDDRLLNDISAGSPRPSIIQWAKPGLTANDLAAWKVTDYRNVGGVNNGNFLSIANSPPGGAQAFTGFYPVVNFDSDTNHNSGEYRTDNGHDGYFFPQGGGDNFVIDATTVIKVPTSGYYSFNGAHDDAWHVEISTPSGLVTLEDLSCCGSNPRAAWLPAGVYPIRFVFGEYGGGEHGELGVAPGVVNNGGAGYTLLGEAGPIQIHQNASALGGLTSAQVTLAPRGFTVGTWTTGSIPGNDGSVDSTTEALTLIQSAIANNVTPAGMDMPQTIFYDNGGAAFPAGTPADQFVLGAQGYVDVLDPTGIDSNVFFYINSDDGFALFINGVEVSRFEGPTGGSDTLAGPFVLKDNDLLQLVYWEAGGGQFVHLFRDGDGSSGTTFDRALIGDIASGIQILKAPQVPEPASATLALLAMGALAMRRRRQA